MLVAHGISDAVRSVRTRCPLPAAPRQRKKISNAQPSLASKPAMGDPTSAIAASATEADTQQPAGMSEMDRAMAAYDIPAEEGAEEGATTAGATTAGTIHAYCSSWPWPASTSPASTSPAAPNNLAWPASARTICA